VKKYIYKRNFTNVMEEFKRRVFESQKVFVRCGDALAVITKKEALRLADMWGVPSFQWYESYRQLIIRRFDA
jgi:hypothetical protein